MGANCSNCNQCQKDKMELNNEVEVTKKSDIQKVSSQSQQSSNGLIDGVNDLKQTKCTSKEKKNKMFSVFSDDQGKEKKKQNNLNEKAIVIQKNWKGHKVRQSYKDSKLSQPETQKGDKKQDQQQEQYDQATVSSKDKKKYFNSQEFGISNVNNAQSREKRPLFVFKSGATYEGEWVGNKRDGKGVQIWPDGAKYDGEWSDNKACGKGSFFHVDGDSYVGEWAEDKANGYGVYRQSNGAIYEGFWRNDQQHGKGEEKWSDLSSYKGDYFEGKKQGEGKYVWPDGSYFQGDWFENKINGYGEYYWSDGRIYKGAWLDNKMHGEGVYQWADGRIYCLVKKPLFQNYLNLKQQKLITMQSQFISNRKFHQKQMQNQNNKFFIYFTKFYSKNKIEIFSKQARMNKYLGQQEIIFFTIKVKLFSGTIISMVFVKSHIEFFIAQYHGSYVNDKKQGLGKYKWPDGRQYVGEWHDGKQHGKGKYILSDGKTKFGVWEKGRRLRWTEE